LVLLDDAVVPVQWGWRLGFVLGAAMAVAILLVRRHVPESPRWLLAHGRAREAERIVAGIEALVSARHGPLPPVPAPAPAHPQADCRKPPSLAEIAHALVHVYRRRSAVAMALMVSQAFFYNAIFFTYALVLTRFHDVPDDRVGL